MITNTEEKNVSRRETYDANTILSACLPKEAQTHGKNNENTQAAIDSRDLRRPILDMWWNANVALLPLEN